MSSNIEQDADCALYSGTFVYPCLDCGDTVHVVDTVRQPHDCQPLTDLHEVIAHAWWAGYDARTAFEPSGGVPAAHVGDETCAQPADAKFWTVHVHGLDDVIPFDTEDEAASYEAAIVDLTKPGGPLHPSSPFDPVITAHVIPPVRPVEPVADTEAVKAADMRGNLTKMIADVIAMHPCDRDVDGHQGADCPQARAVIESLSRPPALRALVELAPDHPRKPVLSEPRPVAEKSSNEFRNVVLDRAAAIAREASS